MTPSGTRSSPENCSSRDLQLEICHLTWRRVAVVFEHPPVLSGNTESTGARSS